MNDIAVGVLTHLLATGIGASAAQGYHRVKAKRGARGQRALLAGLEDALFVFPERHADPDAILPRTATEDFLAINNLISAFQRCGMKPPERVRTPPRQLTVQDKNSHSLILICSPVRNETSKEFLDQLAAALPADTIPRFEEYCVSNNTKPRRLIRWGMCEWKSRSWEQSGPTFEDVAILIKARNPWAPERSVLFIAGARGIGTWGAAEFVKKNWRELFTRRGGELRPTDSVAAVLQVVYENRDIRKTHILQCEDIKYST